MNTHKLSIGQTLLLTNNVEVEILNTSSFGGVPHYGVRFITWQTGQPRKESLGWMPVDVLDEGSGFVRL